MSERQIKYIDDIGQCVRLVRKAQGLKQADAAGLMGVGIRFLSELENGKTSLEVGKVLQVLQALGIEVHLRTKN